jgi:hypothetical protein
VVAGRFPGTCAWVFGHDSYVKWSTQGGVLWMNGIGESMIWEQEYQELTADIGLCPRSSQPDTASRLSCK